MKELFSCTQATKEAMDQVYFSIAHLYKEEKALEMHIHDCYELYYSISGGKQFLIDNHFYPIEPGDIFVINPYESHYIAQFDSDSHERLVISIHPDFVRQLSSDATDLSACFLKRPRSFSHRLPLNQNQQQRFRYYVNQLLSDTATPAAPVYGQDLYERAIFTELLLFVNRCYLNRLGEPAAEAENAVYNKQIDEILAYLNQNISEPLSISGLASHFYLSESYICRIFKTSTGMTLHKYITARRISIAKSLLADGMDASLVCSQCGYHDYSNFVRAFTGAVGISPKKYALQSQKLL